MWWNIAGNSAWEDAIVEQSNTIANGVHLTREGSVSYCKQRSISLMAHTHLPVSRIYMVLCLHNYET